MIDWQIKSAFTFILALLYVSGCGANVFKDSDAGDPAEDAVIALENDKPDKAISILETALAEQPDQPTYLSLLSAAYAQRAGVEPIRFARDMAALGGSSGSLLAAFAILPKATVNVLSDIDKSVTILADLGADRFLPGDALKLGLYQSASFLLHSKALDQNQDGVISADEAVDLSDNSANGLLIQIAAAQVTLAAQAASDPSAAKASESLEDFQSDIDNQPGDTQEEKLRNYLSARQNRAP